MMSRDALICSSDGPAFLERPRFVPRQIIKPEDLTQVITYSREKQRRHNRLLHGWGVVCGARVKQGKNPCEIVIEPGYILGPYGDEILIDREVTVNLCQEGLDGNAVSPCVEMSEPWCSNVRVDRPSGRPLYVAVRYAECQTSPVRVVSMGCGCNETECEYSRIRDSYAIKALTSLPSTYSDPMPEPKFEDVLRCTQEQSCPACPTEPWVILADVTLGSDGNITNLDCFTHRRHVVSFANYYFLCKPVVAPPRIVAISPGNGESRSIDNWSPELARLQITFDREMSVENSLREPDNWLRLWRLVMTSDSSTVIVTVVNRISLEYLALDSGQVPGTTQFKAVYRLQNSDVPANTRYLFQIRATSNEIVDTSTPPQLLDPEFKGTGLAESILDEIWLESNDSFSLPNAVFENLSFPPGMPTALPSGDGKPGGFFHSWFSISRD